MTESIDEADAAYLAAIEAEYGKYVAAGPILVDGALAYNKGQRVPVSAVEGDRPTVDREAVTLADGTDPAPSEPPAPPPTVLSPPTITDAQEG